VHACTHIRTGRRYAVKVLWMAQYTDPQDAVSYLFLSLFYSILPWPSMIRWANSTCYRTMSRTRWLCSRGFGAPAARSLTLSTSSSRRATVCISLSTLFLSLFISWSTLICGNVGYIVMRLADGGDLDRHLCTGRYFEEHEVADVMLDVFTGLQVLHDDLGVAHRGMFLSFSLCSAL
jgi:serine/threonine protein kinase